MSLDFETAQAGRPGVYFVRLVEAYGLQEGIVLSWLVTQANEEGKVFASLSTIAWTTGIPEAAIKRSLDKLRTSGTIQAVYSRTKHRQGYFAEILDLAFVRPNAALAQDLFQDTKTHGDSATQETKHPEKPFTPGGDKPASEPTKSSPGPFGEEGGPLGGETGDRDRSPRSDDPDQVDPDPVDPGRPIGRDKVAFRRFVDLWFKAWKEHNGARYRMDGKDASRVYEILATGLSPEDLVEAAKAAWISKLWFCKGSGTIHGFARNLREILTQVPFNRENKFDDWKQWTQPKQEKD